MIRRGARPFRALASRLGHRGAFLLALGALWLLYGYGLLVTPLPPSAAAAYRTLLDLWPMGVWAWLWIAAGGTAVVCAWLRQPRDWIGFAASFPLACAWGLSSLMSWWPLGDNPRGWIGAAVWVVFGGLIGAVVAWPEPPKERGGSAES